MQASSSTSSSEHKKKSSGTGKFFRKLLILLVVVIVFDQLTGAVLHYVYFRQKAGPNAETTYTLTRLDTEGFILGSSRGRRNYNPNIIADSLGITLYNAGHDGQTVFYEQAIVRMALDRYTPELVIIDLNPEEIYFREVHYDRLNVLAPYYQDYPLVRDIYLLKGVRNRRKTENKITVLPEKAANNSWDNFWFRLHSFEEYVLPVNTEKFKMASAIYPYNSSLLDLGSGLFKNRKSESGFKPLKGIISEKKAEELITQNEKLRLQKGKKIDPNKMNALEEILSSLTLRGTKVVVVMSPALAPFGMEPSYEAIQNICSKYRVPFKDYSQDRDYLHLKYFFDNHMNKDGANLYSSHLAGDIKNVFYPATFDR